MRISSLRELRARRKIQQVLRLHRCLAWRRSHFAQEDNLNKLFSKLTTSVSDQAGADAAEEVFAVGFGLGQDLGLIPVLQSDFLQEEFDGIFGLEALGH